MANYLDDMSVMQTLFDTLYIGRYKHPEEKLATAVILCAVRDLGSKDEIERSEAVNFLTNQNDSWSKSRKFWCEVIQLDEGFVRSTCLDLIDNKNLNAVIKYNHVLTNKLKIKKNKR
jgi:hypothetical protein